MTEYQHSGGGMNYFSLDAYSQDESVNRSTLNGQHVSIQSGGDTTLAAVTVNAQSLDIDAKGKLILPAVTTQDSEGWNVTHGSSASVGARGKGRSDQTLNYTQFNVSGKTNINAQGGIQAQVGQNVNLQDLAQQPGMGWVSKITNDPKLAGSAEWQRVKEAHEQWAYRQSGMGPVSAALVAVMVAAAAALAAGAAGATAGNAAAVAAGEGVALANGSVFLTATGSTISAAAAGAVEAGVLALSSQVGVSFFNNGGDLGKVFKELGESDSIKNLATAIVTGGVLGGMGLNALGEQTVGAGGKQLGDQFINNLRIQGASTLIDSTINGGSFEDGLKTVLINALVNTIAATTANEIGGLTGEGKPLNKLTNKLAHLMAGCATGAMSAGSGSGCAAGGIGAAIGEMMAEAIGSGTNGVPRGWTDQNTVYLAGLFGGLAVSLTGGDPEQVAIGNTMASNAAANNYLDHRRPSLLALSEQERYENAVKACAGGDAAACTTKQELAQVSANRANALNEACAGGASTPQCRAETAKATEYGNTVVRDGYGNTFATSDYPNGYPSAGPIRSPMEDAFAGQAAQSTATGLALVAPYALQPTGSALWAWQSSVAPAQALTASQLLGGGLTSGATSTGMYLLLNRQDSTPSGALIAFGAGYVGAGLSRRLINYNAGLPHTIFPVSVDTAATQFVGTLAGYGAFGWMNRTEIPNSGSSWWTRPIFEN
ncbi:DUF637 domain-containing protein [Variovorax soli]|uniref:DUF637 domain-containing protein n=1 Tax=Variovorax soli TaxID=376815 RepID=UPI0008381DE5|nr:DUF637 domain-containing protein [Variovorax soli]